MVNAKKQTPLGFKKGFLLTRKPPSDITPERAVDATSKTSLDSQENAKGRIKAQARESLLDWEDNGKNGTRAPLIFVKNVKQEKESTSLVIQEDEDRTVENECAVQEEHTWLLEVVENDSTTPIAPGTTASRPQNAQIFFEVDQTPAHIAEVHTTTRKPKATDSGSSNTLMELSTDEQALRLKRQNEMRKDLSNLLSRLKLQKPKNQELIVHEFLSQYHGQPLRREIWLLLLVSLSSSACTTDIYPKKYLARCMLNADPQGFVSLVVDTELSPLQKWTVVSLVSEHWASQDTTRITQECLDIPSLLLAQLLQWLASLCDKRKRTKLSQLSWETAVTLCCLKYEQLILVPRPSLQSLMQHLLEIHLQWLLGDNANGCWDPLTVSHGNVRRHCRIAVATDWVQSMKDIGDVGSFKDEKKKWTYLLYSSDETTHLHKNNVINELLHYRRTTQDWSVILEQLKRCFPKQPSVRTLCAKDAQQLVSALRQALNAIACNPSVAIRNSEKIFFGFLRVPDLRILKLVCTTISVIRVSEPLSAELENPLISSYIEAITPAIASFDEKAPEIRMLINLSTKLMMAGRNWMERLLTIDQREFAACMVVELLSQEHLHRGGDPDLLNRACDMLLRLCTSSHVAREFILADGKWAALVDSDALVEAVFRTIPKEITGTTSKFTEMPSMKCLGMTLLYSLEISSVEDRRRRLKKIIEHLHKVKPTEVRGLRDFQSWLSLIWRRALLSRNYAFFSLSFVELVKETVGLFIAFPQNSETLSFIGAMVDDGNEAGEVQANVAQEIISLAVTAFHKLESPENTIFDRIAPLLVLRTVPAPYYRFSLRQLNSGPEERKTTNLSRLAAFLNRRIKSSGNIYTTEERRLAAEIGGRVLPLGCLQRDGTSLPKCAYACFDVICLDSFSKCLEYFQGAVASEPEDLILSTAAALYALYNLIPFAEGWENGFALLHAGFYCFQYLAVDQESVDAEQKPAVQKLQNGCVEFLALCIERAVHYKLSDNSVLSVSSDHFHKYIEQDMWLPFKEAVVILACETCLVCFTRVSNFDWGVPLDESNASPREYSVQCACLLWRCFLVIAQRTNDADSVARVLLPVLVVCLMKHNNPLTEFRCLVPALDTLFVLVSRCRSIQDTEGKLLLLFRLMIDILDCDQSEDAPDIRFHALKLLILLISDDCIGEGDKHDAIRVIIKLSYVQGTDDSVGDLARKCLLSIEADAGSAAESIDR